MVGKRPSLPLNRQGWQRCVFELGDSPRPPARDGKNGVWGNAPDAKNSPWLNLLVEKRGALGGVVTEPVFQPSELNQKQTRLRALRYGAVNQTQTRLRALRYGAVNQKQERKNER